MYIENDGKRRTQNTVANKDSDIVVINEKLQNISYI